MCRSKYRPAAPHNGWGRTTTNETKGTVSAQSPDPLAQAALRLPVSEAQCKDDLEITAEDVQSSLRADS
jgi:hypothetical protein